MDWMEGIDQGAGKDPSASLRRTPWVAFVPGTDIRPLVASLCQEDRLETIVNACAQILTRLKVRHILPS